MQSHKQEAVKPQNELLDNHLPTNYSPEAVTRLAKKGIIVSKEVVRNARNGRSTRYAAQIMTELIAMANEEKKAYDTLQETLNPHNNG